MNGFSQFAEMPLTECKLSKFVKEFPNKSLDYKELDKPIKNTRVLDSDGISFGSAKDAANYAGEAKRREDNAKHQANLARIDINNGNLGTAELELKWAAEEERKAKDAEVKAKEELKKIEVE